MGTGFTPGRIHVGAARIFTNCTAGASGLPPTPIAHSAGVPSAGSPNEVGLTRDDTTFSYKATKTEIMAEQSLMAVDAFVGLEEASLSFTCLESTYASLKTAFDNVYSGSPAGGDIFAFGGGSTIVNPTTTCVFFSSLQRAGTYYVVGAIYKAYSAEGYQVGFSKTKELLYKVTLKAIADLTRTAGDQAGYFRYEHA